MSQSETRSYAGQSFPYKQLKWNASSSNEQQNNPNNASTDYHYNSNLFNPPSNMVPGTEIQN